MDYATEYDMSDNDSTATTTPGQDATIDQLREALKREQLKNQKLMENNKKLRSGEGDIGVPKAPGKKGRKPKADADIPDQLAPHVEQITRLGKKCAVMLTLWVPDEIFNKKRPTFDYTDANRRYASPENETTALIAELYDFIPEEYHAFCLGLPKFGDIFKFGTSAYRSSALHNIRFKAATIFGLNEKYFCGDHSSKDCDEILKLLGYNKEKNAYDTWPPILYPNNVKNLRKPFRNAALPLILKIAFHGAGALNSVGKGRPKANAQLWGVTSVNEAAIAFSAVMGRFVLSKDTEIAPKGAVTGIRYQADFWKYRKVLAKADKGARQDLIDFFNETVFPNRSSMPAKKRDEEDEEEDLMDAILAFNLGPGADDSDLVVNPSAEDTPVSFLQTIPEIMLSTSRHDTPGPTAQARSSVEVDLSANVSSGDIGEPPNDQHDDHGEMVEPPETTKRAKKGKAVSTASKNTTVSRVGRLRKGASDESAIEMNSANERTKDKVARDGRGNAARSKAVDIDSPITARKPISRRSNVVVSDEENEDAVGAIPQKA